MMRVAVLVVAMASAMTAAAQDAAPQASIHPKSRPESAPTVTLPEQVATPQSVDKTDSGADPSTKLQAGQRDLLRLHDYVNLIIPRGGAALHKLCRENSNIPVITGGIGINHIFRLMPAINLNTQFFQVFGIGIFRQIAA